MRINLDSTMQLSTSRYTTRKIRKMRAPQRGPEPAWFEITWLRLTGREA
jgi:hypothetical protein